MQKKSQYQNVKYLILGRGDSMEQIQTDESAWKMAYSLQENKQK